MSSQSHPYTEAQHVLTQQPATVTTSASAFGTAAPAPMASIDEVTSSALSTPQQALRAGLPASQSSNRLGSYWSMPDMTSSVSGQLDRMIRDPSQLSMSRQAGTVMHAVDTQLPSIESMNLSQHRQMASAALALSQSGTALTQQPQQQQQVSSSAQRLPPSGSRLSVASSASSISRLAPGDARNSDQILLSEPARSRSHLSDHVGTTQAISTQKEPAPSISGLRLLNAGAAAPGVSDATEVALLKHHLQQMVTGSTRTVLFLNCCELTQSLNPQRQEFARELQEQASLHQAFVRKQTDTMRQQIEQLRTQLVQERTANRSQLLFADSMSPPTRNTGAYMESHSYGHADAAAGR